jgi:hypothetical protein
LILADSNTLSLDDLDIVQAREDFVLDLELSRHGELATLLNLKWLILERGLGTLGGEVDSDGWTAF